MKCSADAEQLIWLASNFSGAEPMYFTVLGISMSRDQPIPDPSASIANAFHDIALNLQASWCRQR
ncbi:hypothetical protein CHELA20_10769 [Hyphomicrobiales bacterium]|nr:hypothetical protein CHELA20_10769 [Hyphomicrobiales bacterium]CAH1693648.1 hypothetical protein CHELA41_51000 [Hyphomicrobiales bacterium]